VEVLEVPSSLVQIYFLGCEKELSLLSKPTVLSAQCRILSDNESIIIIILLLHYIPVIVHLQLVQLEIEVGTLNYFQFLKLLLKHSGILQFSTFDTLWVR
jgi:hypothetical protein